MDYVGFIEYAPDVALTDLDTNLLGEMSGEKPHVPTVLEVAEEAWTLES